MNYQALLHGLSGFIIVLALGAACHSWRKHLKTDMSRAAFVGDADHFNSSNAYARTKLALTLLALGIVLHLLSK